MGRQVGVPAQIGSLHDNENDVRGSSTAIVVTSYLAASLRSMGKSSCASTRELNRKVITSKKTTKPHLKTLMVR